MYIKNEKINTELINKKTKINLEKIGEKVLNSLENTSSECDYCFFLYSKEKRVGGRAMTTISCGWCEKEMNFTSTVIDACCVNCAKNHQTCSHCGCDRNLRIRSN